MIYSFDITTPENTAETAPLRTTVKLARGIIHQVDIDFPPGPAGLLRVAIELGAHRLWPSTGNAWFRGDDRLISFPEWFPLLWPPYTLDIVTWNADTEYSHIVIVRFGILEERYASRRFGGAGRGGWI